MWHLSHCVVLKVQMWRECTCWGTVSQNHMVIYKGSMWKKYHSNNCFLNCLDVLVLLSFTMIFFTCFCFSKIKKNDWHTIKCCLMWQLKYIHIDSIVCSIYLKNVYRIAYSATHSLVQQLWKVQHIEYLK